MFLISSIDRILITMSLAWLLILLGEPALQADKNIFGGSVLLIAFNGLASIWALTTRRKVLIGLNCTQIVLFGMLNFQLYRAFGPEHYQFDRQPLAVDWVEFTIAHFFRAADVLDALDEYGIDLQNIRHNSKSAGIILVCMHLGVDVFLLGLAIGWLSRLRQRPEETILARGRRRLSWVLVCASLFFGFAVGQGWSAADWLLWPLDNMLRVLDVGDFFQIFGWRLHDVDMGFWTRSYAMFFRLLIGIGLAQIVLWARLLYLRGWGLRIDQLVETLTEGDAIARRGAAKALGEDDDEVEHAIAPLMGALRDTDPMVRREAAAALGRIGARAREAVPELARAMWAENRSLALAAADALRRMGPDAIEAWDDLWWLWKVERGAFKEIAEESLRGIDPEVFRERRARAIALEPAIQKLPREKRYLIF